MNTKIEIAQFLGTLGWKYTGHESAPAIRPDTASVCNENKTVPELRVDRAQRGDAATRLDVFVLSASDRYQRRVKRTLVYANLPRWQRKVHAWFQAATLAIADAKREEDEENARVRCEERTIDDLVRACTGDDVDPAEVRRLVGVTFHRDEAGTLSVHGVSRRYYVPDMFVFDHALTDAERLAKLGRLVRFLRSENMLPSQYRDGTRKTD